MTHIAPLEQISSDSNLKIVKKVKEKLCEDRDPFVLKCMVNLLQHKKLFKYIQIILFCFHVGGLIYSTQGKYRFLYEEQNMDRAVVKFVDTLSNILLTATNIVGFIIFSKSAALYNFIFDVLKNKSSNKELGKRRFKRSMITLHVLIFLSTFFTIYVFVFKVGWHLYQYLIARDLELYCFNILMYIILCFAHKIKENFQKVNQLLLEIDQEFLVPDSDDDNNKKIGDQQSAKYLQRLKSLTQYHNSICNLLDKYNDYFKTVLVLLVMCIVGNLLWDCTILIEFSIKPSFLNDVKAASAYGFIIYPLLIVITAGQAALGAFVGESLTGEGQKITVQCYSLLNKLPTHIESKTDRLVEKQINLLLDQSKTRNVSLHAGGFFKLDWGILGSIASTVATYSIVIIQFLYK